MQKIFNMNKQEIAQGLSQFVMMAFIGPQNIETGFLTRHRIKKMTKGQIMGFSMETEKIINKLSHQLEQVADGNIPDDYECGTLFQYVFDKVTEALYKLLMGEEVDTQFNLKEAFDYHEPDLPEYIQLKLTNVVGKIAIIHSRILHYLDENNSRTSDLEQWLPAYLMVAVIIAIQFAQEIDPDDDSEIQAYLNS